MTQDQLSRTLGALADPTRRAILARLSGGEAAVTELCRGFAISQPAVSKHLKVLETAGLVERGQHAQWRPARLATAPLQQLDAWLDPFRRLWEERLDRLEAHLLKIQGEPHDPGS